MTTARTSENPAAHLAWQQRGSLGDDHTTITAAESLPAAYDISVSALEAIFALKFRGIDVQPDHDYGVPEQREWCGDVGALATVRVYGEPAEDLDDIEPIRLKEICPQCAPEVILRASAEQDSRSRLPIRVEVAA